MKLESSSSHWERQHLFAGGACGHSQYQGTLWSWNLSRLKYIDTDDKIIRVLLSTVRDSGKDSARYLGRKPVSNPQKPELSHTCNP